MLSAILSIIPGMFKLGDKLIVDEDKKMEFAFKAQEMVFKMMETMLNTKTYPWIDGLVKLAYAGEQIVKGLLRPLGSAALTGIVIYCAMKGIDLPDSINIIGSAAFPGWMTSRHIQKAKEIKSTPDDYDF